MKRKGFLALLLVLSIFALTACGGGDSGDGGGSDKLY